MVVERRWTVPELPEDELLDALAHCYGVLASIVSEAHELVGINMQTFGGETHGARHRRELHPSGRLPCMLPTARMRTAYWHLATGALIDHVVEDTDLPREDEWAAIAKEATRRYGDLPSPFGAAMSMVDRATATHEVARAILRADGYHRTFAWAFRDAEPVGQFVLDPEDNQDKIVKMRWLATEVQELQADAVILVAEVWHAIAVPDDDPRFDLRAAERDDRTEAIATYLLERGAETRAWLSPFTRGPADEIILDEVDTPPLPNVALFTPILRVWEEWDVSSEHAISPHA